MVSRLLESEVRWLRALLVLGTVTVSLVLAGIVANILVYFSDIVLIVVMAWVFAFLLSPVVALILRAFPRLPRSVVVVGVYIGLFLLLSALVLLMAANLAQSITALIDDLPTLRERLPVILDEWQTWLTSLGLQVDLVASAEQALQGVVDISGDFLGPIRDIALFSLGVIGNLLLVVFLSLFIVIDKDQLLAFVNRVTPPRFADEVRLFQTSVASSVGGFVRGQAVQGLIYGAIALAGSLALGLPYAPLTTTLVAVLQMVPFFGPFFSWAPPVVVAVLAQPEDALLIFAIMAAGWFVVMNIVQPRVMASSVGIHPVVVLVSVLIGIKLQGVVGAIFAIPVAAVLSAFFFHYLNQSQGGPRDVTSRAARLVEEREGRRVRVPAPPPVAASGMGAEVATAAAGQGGPRGSRTGEPSP